MRRHVDGLAARVLVLALAGERDRQHLAVRALAEQPDGGVLHRQLRAEVAVDPLHRRVLVGDGALRDEVVDVRRPVLDRRVAAAAALLDDDLDDGGVQRVGRVDRRRAALDVVHVRALVDDDQRALELAHVLRVDAEVGLERHLDLHARRHVDERAARPDGGVERRELVVVLRDDLPEVLLDEILVLAEARVHVEEEDALLLEALLELVVDDLGLVLRADAGEVLLLGLGDAELVPGVEDVGGQVLPVLRLLLRGLDVVVDVLEVDRGHVAAPRGQRPRVEVLERLVAELPHPGGLVLVARDGVDQLVRQAAARLEEVVLGDVEAVLDLVVGADSLDDLGLGLCHYASPPPTAAGANASYPSASSLCASSGPPSSTIRPSTKTCTKSGLMWFSRRW